MKHPTVLVSLLFFGISICQAQKNLPSDFVVDGFVISETILGDLNNDGLEDTILIVKGTDKQNVVINRFDEKVDRNRRGIIILFKTKDSYNLVLENYNCFYSENEDGGVYFPPELSVSIDNDKLYVNYAHGRYGYWKYTFRFKDSDFELIGYDASNNFGAVVNAVISINFLTKNKLTKENTNKNDDGGQEVFKETSTKIEIDRLIKLSEIKDFSELDMSKY